METTEYIPYGPEWVKEMKKLPKDFLIEMARKSFVKENAAVELLKEAYEELHFDNANQSSTAIKIDSFLKENNL